MPDERDPLTALLSAVDSALARLLLPFVRDLVRRVRRAGGDGAIGAPGRQGLASYLTSALGELFGTDPAAVESLYAVPGTVPHLLAASTRAAARVSVAPVVSQVSRALAGEPALLAALTTPRGVSGGNPRPPLFDPARTWVDPNGYRLSDRIWQNGQEVRAKIDALLDYGIANGASAVDIGKALEGFLTHEGRFSGQRILVKQPDGSMKLEPRPITTRTPYGRVGLANPRRLARTETSRAYNSAAAQAASRNPFVAGIGYRKSGSHSGDDICDERAAADPDGLGAGNYKAANFPTPPSHPNCLCYSTPIERQDTDRVLADLARWVNGDLPADWGGLDTEALVTQVSGFPQRAG